MSGGSGGPPVLWLSTNAVQLTVPIGDDGQLMSGGSGAPPVLWLSTNKVQFFRRPRRALFRLSFAFLFYTRQTFPFFFRSSDFSAPLRSSFPLVNNSRNFWDGGVFRQQGNSLGRLGIFKGSAR